MCPQDAPGLGSTVSKTSKCLSDQPSQDDRACVGSRGGTSQRKTAAFRKIQADGITVPSASLMPSLSVMVETWMAGTTSSARKLVKPSERVGEVWKALGWAYACLDREAAKTVAAFLLLSPEVMRVGARAQSWRASRAEDMMAGRNDDGAAAPRAIRVRNASVTRSCDNRPIDFGLYAHQ